MAAATLRSALLLATALAAPAPPPPAGTVKIWPKCIIEDMSLRSAKPVLTDVRTFITNQEAHRHRTVTFSSAGVVGMVLADDPHDLGEIVKDVVNGSQAHSAGVSKGWIITDVDGRKFTSKERLKDVAEDFTKAKRAGATLVVKYDIRSYFDCLNGDCTNSDRFPTDDPEFCADACVQVAGCDWWSFGDQDEDAMCWLQASQGSSLMKWEGIQTAPRVCAPKPPTDAAHITASWPSCQVYGSHIFEDGGPVFADVRKFIRNEDGWRHRVITFKSEGDLGMTLRDKAHDEGELVDEVKPNSQAYKAGVRKGWIIKELDGKPFKKDESVTGIGQDFQSAKNKAPTVIVKFDVHTSWDCNGNCDHSDKFAVASAAECAAACREIPACKWWTFGTEEDDTMCWMRNSDRGIKPEKLSISGLASCSPAKRGMLYKVCLLLLVAAVVYYRRELSEKFLSVPVLQPLKLVLANFVSKVSRKLKRDNDSYDFDFDGSMAPEERHGLINKYGRPPMDFDEL